MQCREEKIICEEIVRCGAIIWRSLLIMCLWTEIENEKEEISTYRNDFIHALNPYVQPVFFSFLLILCRKNAEFKWGSLVRPNLTSCEAQNYLLSTKFWLQNLEQKMTLKFEMILRSSECLVVMLMNINFWMTLEAYVGKLSRTTQIFNLFPKYEIWWRR